MAVLPCPHKKGDISWSRFINGEKILLVSFKNGRETRTDKRFGYQADNSLVIMKVEPSDSGMYFCNQSQIYLEVTTDPSAVTLRPGGRGLDLGPGREGDAADTENQQSSDLWKVLAGVIVAVSLALLSVFTWRICSRRTRVTKTTSRTRDEEIYDDIGAAEEQPRGGSDEEPHYWTSETQSPITTPDNHLYSTINRLETNSGEQQVYYLAQNPAQAGNSWE